MIDYGNLQVLGCVELAVGYLNCEQVEVVRVVVVRVVEVGGIDEGKGAAGCVQVEEGLVRSARDCENKGVALGVGCVEVANVCLLLIDNLVGQ